MPDGKDPDAQVPKSPPLASRPTPAALEPLPQRPALEPLEGKSVLPALSKPRLPTTIPNQPPPPSATPQPSTLPPGAAAEKPTDKAPATAPPTAPPPPPPAPVIVPTPLPGDTREPASIEGLASPAAAPADSGADSGGTTTNTATITTPPARAASAAPSVPAQPLVIPPSPPLLQSPRDAPSPQTSVPPPLLPGAVPNTPTAGAAQQRAQVTAPVAAAAAPEALSGPKAGPIGPKTREPPKEPPPPAAVEHMTVTTDCRTVEQYIPFGFVELRGRLLADFPEAFNSPDVCKKFVELCKWISLRNTLRLELDYGDAHEKYAPLDPDKDTLAFQAAMAAEKDAAAAAVVAPTTSSAVAPAPGPIKPPLDRNDLKSMVGDLYGELNRILEKAEFSEMPPEDLEIAKNHKSLMGLEVTPASDDILEYRIHYRGTRTKKVQFRRWGLIKRQIEMNVYERLAICFRLKKPVSQDDVPHHQPGDGAGIDNRSWCQRLLCCNRESVSPALLELRDEFVYMKLFKDVLQSDVDMLLPGAVIKFTWLDHMMIWVPILVGCGMAVWKAISGTINFTSLMDALLSIVLIVMPITWGVRAYFAIKEKQRLHQAHLNALFLLHNLNNNAGVISQLLGEAQEQEDNETMLAYFFLWRGQLDPKPMPKVDLDRAVEAYLQSKLDDLKVPIRMDYEVLDGIAKLERLGLVQISRGPDGSRRLQALPLDLAVEKAHVRHFDESREAGQPEVPPSEAKRQGAISLNWHECMDVFGPTGQKFRYFWNAQTNESQYNEPDEPYIKLGASAALDFEEAHGIKMADSQVQPPPNSESAGLHHAKTA